MNGLNSIDFIEEIADALIIVGKASGGSDKYVLSIDWVNFHSIKQAWTLTSPQIIGTFNNWDFVYFIEVNKIYKATSATLNYETFSTYTPTCFYF